MSVLLLIFLPNRNGPLDFPVWQSPFFLFQNVGANDNSDKGIAIINENNKPLCAFLPHYLKASKAFSTRYFLEVRVELFFGEQAAGDSLYLNGEFPSKKAVE